MKPKDWPGDGYRLTSRTPPLLVCERCGALVVYGSVDQHDEWHTRQER